jgi:hypothetical protein
VAVERHRFHNQPEAGPVQQRVLYERIRAAATQLRTARLTRASLVLNAATPLTPYPHVERELALCSGAIRLGAAAAPASVGDACLGFWAQHRLAPIDCGVRVGKTPGDKLASRRLLLHDLLHVLLEFDMDWPGQFGVFSFVAAQNYCPQFERAARNVGRVYMTTAPWLRDALGAAEYRARHLALAAPRLLSMPIEHEWHTPLRTLQIKLKLKRERSLRPLVPLLQPPQARRSAAGAAAAD